MTTDSDAVLAALLESNDEAVFSVDTEYRYTSFNSAHARAMKDLYGSTISVGMSVVDAMTEWDDRQSITGSLDRALAGERHCKKVFAGDSALGRRYYQITHSPVTDANGRIIGVLVQPDDITCVVEAAEMERYEYERIHLINALTSRSEASAEQIIQTGLELLVSMTGSRLGLFDAFDEATGSFTIRAWSKGAREAGAASDATEGFSLESAGAWSEVIKQRAPVVDNEFGMADPAKAGFPECGVSLERWVAVPVFNAGRIVAAAVVADKATPYGPQDTSALFSAANSVWTIAELRHADELLEQAAEAG